MSLVGKGGRSGPRRAEVLLAGAAGRPGLAAARSLARRGVSFVVVGCGPRDMVASSRHVRRYVPAPAPGDDPDAFFGTVLETCTEHDVPLVIPAEDTVLAACSEHRDALPAGTRLAAANPDAVRNVLDKRQNLETARRLGIPLPAEFTVEDIGQVEELIERLGFPMVLKNTGLGTGPAGLGSGFKWLIAHDEAELRELLDQHCRDGRFPLFQELVDGTVTNLCCFAAAGEIVAAHQYRSLRRMGWEGNSILREVTATDPRLLDYAQRLLGELRWDGVAQVAFIVRERDGGSWYMETNGRFWGSIQGSIAIGWDFPYWTYRYFSDGEVPSPPPPVVGSRTCWHFADLLLLARRLRGTEPPVPPGPSAIRSVADYLTGFTPGVHSDVFALDDPVPELVEHVDGLRAVLGRRLARTP